MVLLETSYVIHDPQRRFLNKSDDALFESVVWKLEDGHCIGRFNRVYLEKPTIFETLAKFDLYTYPDNWKIRPFTQEERREHFQSIVGSCCIL